MEESKKDGYIAGILLLLIAGIFIVPNTNLETEAAYTMLFFGIVLGILGLGSLWKPESVGQIAAELIRRIQKNSETIGRQYNYGGNKEVTINITNSHVEGGIGSVVKTEMAKLDTSDASVLKQSKKPEFVLELCEDVIHNSDKFTITSLTQKARAIADIVGDEEKVKWLTNELNGYKEHQASSIPKYRVVNGVIDVELQVNETHWDMRQHPIKLIMPISISQIEEIKNQRGAVRLTAPAIKPFAELIQKMGPDTKMNFDPEAIPYLIQSHEMNPLIEALKNEINAYVLDAYKRIKKSE